MTGLLGESPLLRTHPPPNLPPYADYFLLYSPQCIGHVIAAFQSSWVTRIAGSWLYELHTNSGATTFLWVYLQKKGGHCAVWVQRKAASQWFKGPRVSLRRKQLPRLCPFRLWDNVVLAFCDHPVCLANPNLNSHTLYGIKGTNSGIYIIEILEILPELIKTWWHKIFKIHEDYRGWVFVSNAHKVFMSQGVCIYCWLT